MDHNLKCIRKVSFAIGHHVHAHGFQGLGHRTFSEDHHTIYHSESINLTEGCKHILLSQK
jgi:hypothetical protein